jgi:hypothetical protein
MNNSDAVWFCPGCEILNIATPDMSITDSLSQNSFNVLSDLEDEAEFDTKLTFGTNTVKTSSPKQTRTRKMCRQNDIEKQRSVGNRKNNNLGDKPRRPPKKLGNVIKITIANFQSIKHKAADLAAFDNTESPDIILGNESWIDDNIASAEIFPSHFQIIRNDRNSSGGGVFIATKDTIPRLERPDLHVIGENCEIIWCQLLLNGTSMFIGSYYRPQKSTTDLSNLNDCLSKIFQENKSPHIILGGDFNLPNMTWKSPIRPSNALQEEIINIANDYGLEQMVLFPTRRHTNGTENILDLCFTTHPSLVRSIHPHSGFGDHSAVIAEFNIKAPIPPKPPREIHLWKKMDEEKFQEDAQAFADKFLNSQPEAKTVEENWCTFRDSMCNLIEENVPTKMVSGSPRVPWLTLTARLLKLCPKKERYYVKANKLGGASRWDKYI